MPDKNKLAAEYAAQSLDVRWANYLWLRRLEAAAEDVVAAIESLPSLLDHVSPILLPKLQVLMWLVKEEKP